MKQVSRGQRVTSVSGFRDARPNERVSNRVGGSMVQREVCEGLGGNRRDPCVRVSAGASRYLDTFKYAAVTRCSYADVE